MACACFTRNCPKFLQCQGCSRSILSGMCPVRTRGCTHPPPIKMDCFENKGVAGRAFCKWLKRKRMDDSKKGQMRREMEGTARKRRSARVRSINHDPCYHELYYLSNDIIVLVFRDLTSFVRTIL